jgi:hypothetical protein
MAGNLLKTMRARAKSVITDIEKVKKQQVKLADRKKVLETSLETMDQALAKLERKRSLQARLQIAKNIINTTTSSIGQLVTPKPDTQFDKRLKSSIEDVIKYLDSVKDEEVKTEKTFSLVLESLRLGRDIVALQIEAIEVQEGHNGRLLAIFNAENILLAQTEDIENLYLVEFRKPPLTETVAQTVQDLSATANSSTRDSIRKDAEENLKLLLDSLGKFQTARITTDSRLAELGLRRTMEDYRRARLLDASYERQRIVLVSAGLEGVVRYSQGGWRREDIGRITSIFGLVAQIVIAAR